MEDHNGMILRTCLGQSDVNIIFIIHVTDENFFVRYSMTYVMVKPIKKGKREDFQTAGNFKRPSITSL